MAAVKSVQNGDWNTTSTWDTGTVPTSADTVYIYHTVTVAADFTANEIVIKDGSLCTADTWGLTSSITGTFKHIVLERMLNDNRKVNLDGVIFSGIEPMISSYITAPDGFPETPAIYEGTNTHLIIDDPGFLSSSSQMQDIKPEGIAHAYARKVSNAVRYMTLTVKIRNDRPFYLASLYRMQQGPFQVLAVTHSCLIKGHIETVVPDASSIGKEYISVKVTIAEGPGA